VQRILPVASSAMKSACSARNLSTSLLISVYVCVCVRVCVERVIDGAPLKTEAAGGFSRLICAAASLPTARSHRPPMAHPKHEHAPVSGRSYSTVPAANAVSSSQAAPERSPGRPLLASICGSVSFGHQGKTGQRTRD
jgi:hypothetical protein